MKYPEKLSLAFIPTPIYKLDKLSKKYGKNIYIKRDDLTGVETSGNKIRKLEYTVKEALDQGCNMLITCGGMQSNHARATAFVAAKLDMACCLLLRGSKEGEKVEGNYFLDKLAGAKVVIEEPEVFNENKNELMAKLKAEYEAKGYKPYIVPMGASNGIGTFGYLNCFNEILEQEKQLGIFFDTIIDAVGSGGTYAGLYLGNMLSEANKNIVGINVCDDAPFFVKEISQIIRETETYLEDEEVDLSKINIIDGYVGRGYALSSPDELETIKNLAKQEAIVLDPVYTGKAYHGFIKELEKGTFKEAQNILFMHTGGLAGLFPKQEEFTFND